MVEPLIRDPSPTPLISDTLAGLLDLSRADRDEAELLLASTDSGDIDSALATLRERLGTFPSAPPRDDLGQQVWICAIILFAPELAGWHASRSIDPEITAATLADVGRQFKLHRTTHGVFGLETWGWLTNHLAGGLFHLGRLQFALRRPAVDDPQPPNTRAWMLDVHIPPIGPLLPDAVAGSFRDATAFFRTHFPDRPTDLAICFSWLLDPYLGEHLAGSNIAEFQRLFCSYGQDQPNQGDILYFVFRTRDPAAMAGLPRRTSLQRVVLERIDGGGVWRKCHGYRYLPG